jgi:hypothetical protein
MSSHKTLFVFLASILLGSCANKQSTVIEYEFPNKRTSILCLKECLADKNSCEYQKEEENKQCKKNSSSISCDNEYYAKDCSSQYRFCYTKCGGTIKERRVYPEDVR